MLSEYAESLCPSLFEMNCKNYEIKCNSCKVNKEGARLEYNPISSDKDLSYKKHPFYSIYKNIVVEKTDEELDKSRKGRVYNRKGRSTERKVLQTIDGVKMTYLSGAYTGNGDGVLTIGGDTLQIEHKTRFNNNSLTGPSKAEWDKGKKQGVDLYLTTSEQLGTLVTMDKKIFDWLLQLINEKAE